MLSLSPLAYEPSASVAQTDATAVMVFKSLTTAATLEVEPHAGSLISWAGVGVRTLISRATCCYLVGFNTANICLWGATPTCVLGSYLPISEANLRESTLALTVFLASDKLEPFIAPHQYERSAIEASARFSFTVVTTIMDLHLSVRRFNPGILPHAPLRL